MDTDKGRWTGVGCLTLNTREGPDCGAGGGEAVATGRREMTNHPHGLEGIDLTGGDVCGRKAAEKLAEQRQESTHDGRVGVGTKHTVPGAHFADDPHDGHATADAIRVGAIAGGQGREALRAVDDERQPFLRVVERCKLLHELRARFN